MHVRVRAFPSSRPSLAQAFARPPPMSSSAEADVLPSGSDYSTTTLDLDTGEKKQWVLWHWGPDRDGRPAPGTPPIIVWSSPSSLGSPWSPQGDEVPEPSLNWHERQKIELQKILDEERAYRRSRVDENVRRLNHKLSHQAVTAIKESTSKSKSKAVTKSNKGKNDKENKGKRDKGNKTKEEKILLKG